MSERFTAGVGAGEIMPTKEMADGSQHSVMTVRTDELGCPLWTKALAMSLGDTTVLLVAVDTCVLNQNHCDLMREKIFEQTDVPVDNIVVSCSHSHSTPIAEKLEDGPHPYFDLICERSTEAAVEAYRSRQPARMGHGSGHVVGASFNTRVPLADGGVKFTRDFREGLASGRPIDPRVSVLRVDDQSGNPLAGWVRLAFHPACVVFDAPVSGEYPGYMTRQLSDTLGHGAPFLFSLGACGDVNCIPMFGSEEDSRRLGLNLASWVGPIFDSIQTVSPSRLTATADTVDLPLDALPTVEQLDREIGEVDEFCKALDSDPSLEWVMGINCEPNWSVENKKKHARLLRDYAVLAKQQIDRGEPFPTEWRSQVAAWVIDDVALVFYSGEPLVELGLELAARSKLDETLLMALSNGADGYVSTDEDRRRGGYEAYTNCRYSNLKLGYRPLPYALGAAERLITKCLAMIDELSG